MLNAIEGEKGSGGRKGQPGDGSINGKLFLPPLPLPLGSFISTALTKLWSLRPGPPSGGGGGALERIAEIDAQ